MVFAENFLWGASNSGFQFEMGNLAGKSIDAGTDWYAWVHDAANIQRGIVSGDLPERGVDYWNLYKRDHALAKELGLNAYRIGVEWSRIFPKSTTAVNVGAERASDGNFTKIDIDDSALERLGKLADKDSMRHYRDMIQDLRANELEVFVCLNHFTLPLWIHDPITVRATRLRSGPRGWIDGSTILEFTKYAAYIALALGDLVDNWATFNEPTVVAETGYMIPQSGFPPGLTDFRASRKVALNLVIAHARSHDAITKIDTVKADGGSGRPANVGLIHNVIPAKPLSPRSKSDAKAAEFMENMHNHFYVQALCSGWLDENLDGVQEQAEVKSYLGHRLDWLGVNYYTRSVVRGKTSLLAKLFRGISAIPEMVRDYGFACQPNGKSADGLPASDLGWEIYPDGLLETLNAMKRYGKPLYVTENGIADARDTVRPRYILDHVHALERAVSEEKIDVRGYFHWSLTDNYEWAKGFRPKFGLYSVNLNTKSRNRRKSAETYKDVIAERK